MSTNAPDAAHPHFSIGVTAIGTGATSATMYGKVMTDPTQTGAAPLRNVTEQEDRVLRNAIKRSATLIDSGRLAASPSPQQETPLWAKQYDDGTWAA